MKKEKENLKKELSAYGLLTTRGKLVSERNQKKVLDKLSGKERIELEKVIDAFQKIKISPTSIAKSMKLKQNGKLWSKGEKEASREAKRVARREARLAKKNLVTS